MSKLSDTQTVVLNRAANHPGGFVDPEGIAAKAPVVRHAILASLVKKGLLAEVEAGRDLPVWRKDGEGVSRALVITAAGKAALGIESEPDTAAAPARKPGKGKATRSTRKTTAEPNGRKAEKANAATASAGERERSARKPTKGKAASATTDKPAPKTREGTKQAQLIAMLSSPKGVTIDEASAALGWLSHTTRAAISHGIGKRLGKTIVSEKNEKRGRVYRIVD